MFPAGKAALFGVEPLVAPRRVKIPRGAERPAAAVRLRDVWQRGALTQRLDEEQTDRLQQYGFRFLVVLLGWPSTISGSPSQTRSA
jgi:hypothetical protein